MYAPHARLNRRDRRTALQLGIWMVVAAVAVTAVLRAVRAEILQNVPEGLYRDGAADVVTAVFSQLRTRGWQMLWTGVLLALLMYLIGRGRGPMWLCGRTVSAWGACRHGRSPRVVQVGPHGTSTPYAWVVRPLRSCWRCCARLGRPCCRSWWCWRSTSCW
ncbi:hypothetical protein ABZX92_42330 [Lentzea sp. NPDC006480]|uniref:hypothetical protein n=1 Tax=Lentzea sp. NPDC006480 TaxID=3157176 RepID=UPI0033B67E2F